MLPQVVPLPTVPAVIATSLVGKLRVVLTTPLTIEEATVFEPLAVIVNCRLLAPRAACCVDLIIPNKAFKETNSSNVAVLFNLFDTIDVITATTAITATNSTTVKPLELKCW